MRNSCTISGSSRESFGSSGHLAGSSGYLAGSSGHSRLFRQEQAQDQLFQEEDQESIQRQQLLQHSRVHQSIQRDHPINNILGSIRRGVTTRSRLANFYEFYSFVSSLEPLRVEQALEDSDWVIAMQE